MNSRRMVAVTRWVLAFASLAGIVEAFRLWAGVNSTTVALTLLLFILLIASAWGLEYALAISVAATACYNFFFLPPIGTFLISDPQNWLALLAFLVTGVVASRLSQRARDQTEAARTRQRELEILFRLSRELLQTESVSSLVSSVPFAVASVTGARSVILYLLEGDRLLQAGNAGVSRAEVPHLRQIAAELTSAAADGEEMQIPLRSGVRPKGLLLLRGTVPSAATSDAMGGLISLSLDRVQALENIARGEAAKESERLRTLMIDSITHELRTPLTSIKGAATMLLAGGIAADSSRELLSIIDEESDRLNKLVSEAVEMAQLDAQQVHMHFATVNLSQVVDQALETCSWIRETHSVTLHIAPQLSIRADADFLKRVICNLVENAAKYSSEGTPITLTAEPRREAILVSVADRGIGIDPSEQTLIFDRFYRAQQHSGDAFGTGMGLAISRSIIEAHGGRISVTSRPGEGSVFTFSVPIGNANGPLEK